MRENTPRKFKNKKNLILLFCSIFLVTTSYVFLKAVYSKGLKEKRDDVLKNSKQVTAEIKALSNKKFNYYTTESVSKDFEKLSAKIFDLQQMFEVDPLEGAIGPDIEQFNSQVGELEAEDREIWSKYMTDLKIFESYVKGNNWKTLTRVSNRVLIRTPQEFVFEKDLDSILQINLKDFEVMKDITQKSTLDAQNKSTIVDKLDKLLLKTNILIQKNQVASEVRGIYTQNVQNFEKWADQWNKLSEEILKNPIEDTFFTYKNFFFLLAFMAGLVLLFYFIFNAIDGKESNKGEQDALNILDKIIVKDDLGFLEGKSERYKSAINTLNNYVKKRMSLGQIFQQTLPFPAILLDENLKFRWFNNHLISQLALDNKLSKEYLTWDFIGPKISLDEDPVVEAFETGIAGIYQVKILTDEGKEKPFQMYVSPVSYANERYVMLIFYPLVTFEETMNLQSQAIVNPVDKTLDLILNEEFTREELNKLEDAYRNVGLSNIFFKFKELIHQNLTEKKTALESLEKLEDKKNGVEQIYTELNQLDSRNHDMYNRIKETFEKFKASFVSYSEGVTQLLSYSLSVKNFLGENDILGQSGNNFWERMWDSSKKLETWGNPSIEELKLEVKKLKNQVKKLDFKKPEKVKEFLAGKDRSLTNIDLFLTKLHMITEDLVKDIQKVKHARGDQANIDKAVKDFNVDRFRIVHQHQEAQLIEDLKNFYDLAREIKRNSHALQRVQMNMNKNQVTDSIH